MDNPVTSNLMQIGILVVAMAMVFIVCMVRKLPIPQTLGLTIPKGRDFLFWIGLYIPIFILGELFYFGMGLQEGRVWEFEGISTILRIIKIAVMGPLVEELVFRGILYDRIATSKPGPVWALILTSLLFTASHFSLQPGDLLIILIDAFYWGLIRYKTGSIVITIILHILVNTMAVFEFLVVNKMM
jgi:membrane protease YdiL (CAAX protease family)